MAKIGMIGGLGPTATLHYYKTIIEDYKYTLNRVDSPEIIIYSMDNSTLLDLIKRERWSILIGWLMKGIKTLHYSGAGFAFIAGTTPHIVFDELKRLSPIPLISIVEESCKHAAALNVDKVGLLGTNFTMQNDFYYQAFKKKGIDLVVPVLSDQQYIHHKMSTEIELGVLSVDMQKNLLEIINRMKNLEGIQAVVFACTKLPSCISQLAIDIPVINTPQIHINSILKYYIKQNN